jgi:hypothetical protein
MKQRTSKERVELFVRQMRELRDELWQAILDQMEIVAIEEGLDEAGFLLGNNYIREGQEVECKRLDKLDEIFYDYVHPGGFQNIWKKGQGWML